MSAHFLCDEIFINFSQANVSHSLWATDHYKDGHNVYYVIQKNRL